MTILKETLNNEIFDIFYTSLFFLLQNSEMLKHVTHRSSTTSLGVGLQPGSASRRASAPSRPFVRQTSDTTSTPRDRQTNTRSPEAGSRSCTSTPGSHRRSSQSPEIRHYQKLLLKREGSDGGRDSPEARLVSSPVLSLSSPRRLVDPRLRRIPQNHEEVDGEDGQHGHPHRLGRSMSTPAGCRYPPPGCVLSTSPIVLTPPESPHSRQILLSSNAHSLQDQGNSQKSVIPENPRSSTLPRRPLPRPCVPTPPLATALSYSSLPPGGRSSLSARSSSTSSLSDTILGFSGPDIGKVSIN